MQETKLTIRVPRELLKNAKKFAAANRTTLTSLIEAYLRRLPGEEALADSPIVRRLSGSLPGDANFQDYREHLEKKYGG